MGSVETRPDNTGLTADNLLIGMPFVEFSRKTGSNPDTFTSYRDLGIVQSAAIAKDIELVTLRTATSGTDVLVRELVRRFEARLNISTSLFDRDNMRLFFASASDPSAIAAGDTVIVDEAVTLGAFADWADLANLIKDSSSFTSLDPAPITGEAVGTGDGASGGTTGDFTLDFRIDTGDAVASVVIYFDGVDVTTLGATIVAGTTPTSAQIAIEEGVSPTGGGGAAITFGSGFIPGTNVAITADYTPTFTLTENTDFVVDYVDGRIRQIGDGSAGQILRDNQPVLADYTTTDNAGHSIVPYSQFVFEGRARLKLLTDIGINVIWTIPAVDLRLNDEDFEFSREEFAEGSLTLTLIDDGSAQPYGTMEIYEETAA